MLSESLRPGVCTTPARHADDPPVLLLLQALFLDDKKNVLLLLFPVYLVCVLSHALLSRRMTSGTN